METSQQQLAYVSHRGNRLSPNASDTAFAISANLEMQRPSSLVVKNNYVRDDLPLDEERIQDGLVRLRKAKSKLASPKNPTEDGPADAYRVSITPSDLQISSKVEEVFHEQINRDSTRGVDISSSHTARVGFGSPCKFHPSLSILRYRDSKTNASNWQVSTSFLPQEAEHTDIMEDGPPPPCRRLEPRSLPTLKVDTIF